MKQVTLRQAFGDDSQKASAKEGNVHKHEHDQVVCQGDAEDEQVPSDLLAAAVPPVPGGVHHLRLHGGLARPEHAPEERGEAEEVSEEAEEVRGGGGERRRR